MVSVYHPELLVLQSWCGSQLLFHPTIQQSPQFVKLNLLLTPACLEKTFLIKSTVPGNALESVKVREYYT